MTRLLERSAVRQALAAGRPEVSGRVVRVVGLTFEIEGLPAAIGDMVRLGNDPGVLGEIVALGEYGPIGMPLGEMRGLQIGTPARLDIAAPACRSGSSCSAGCSTGWAIRSMTGPRSTI